MTSTPVCFLSTTTLQGTESSLFHPLRREIKSITVRTFTGNIHLRLGALLMLKPLKGFAPAIDDKFKMQ